jgi:hypothetical protein
VNFYFINSKNSAVSKLKIFTVNKLPVNARNVKQSFCRSEQALRVPGG